MVKEESYVEGGVVNYAGEPGQEALNLILRVVGNRIRIYDTEDGGGDCLFSTTEFAYWLIRHGRYTGDTATAKLILSRFFLCAGVMDVSDVKPELGTMFHAWLEYRSPAGAVIVNTSNLKDRPLYAMEKDEYHARNRVIERTIRVPFSDVYKRHRPVFDRVEPYSQSGIISLAKTLFRRILFQFQ